MTEFDDNLPNSEFDRSQYPENLACFLLPSPGQKAEIQIRTAEDESPVFYVPHEAVISLGVHNLNTALNVHGVQVKEIEDTLAAAIVACRLGDQTGELDEVKTVAVVLPDNPEPIVVPKQSLARRVAMPEEEPTSEEVSTTEIIDILRELKARGVDFEEEDIETTLGDMEPDEAIGYLIFALEQAGFEDPEAYLKEKGILE